MMIDIPVYRGGSQNFDEATGTYRQQPQQMPYQMPAAGRAAFEADWAKMFGANPMMLGKDGDSMQWAGGTLSRAMRGTEPNMRFQQDGRDFVVGPDLAYATQLAQRFPSVAAEWQKQYGYNPAAPQPEMTTSFGGTSNAPMGVPVTIPKFRNPSQNYGYNPAAQPPEMNTSFGGTSPRTPGQYQQNPRFGGGYFGGLLGGQSQMMQSPYYAGFGGGYPGGGFGGRFNAMPLFGVYNQNLMNMYRR